MEPLGPGDPRQLGAYVLHARLGAGGMGQVFLGYSPAGRAVAVKVIHSGLAREPHFRARFRREVAAAGAVSGAYTAPVTAAGPDDDPPWLATAFVAGPSLDDAVEVAGPLPELSVWKLAAGLAEALQAVHACGLIHRDLKPSNVLLASDGPRVIDFGISHVLESTVMTSTGQLMGTPSFMSPEQARGERAGADSDIFSLGCVIAYAATGRPPFGGSGGPHVTVLYRVVHDEPALTGMPAGLRDLARACLAKEPEARPTLPGLVAAISASRPPDHGSMLEGFWPSAVNALIRSHQEQLSAQIRASREEGPAGEPVAGAVPGPSGPPAPPAQVTVPPVAARRATPAGGTTPAPPPAPAPGLAVEPAPAAEPAPSPGLGLAAKPVAAFASAPAPGPALSAERAPALAPVPAPGPAAVAVPAALAVAGPAPAVAASAAPGKAAPAPAPEPAGPRTDGRAGQSQERPVPGRTAPARPTPALAGPTELVPAPLPAPVVRGRPARLSRRVALTGMVAAAAAGLAGAGWEVTRLGQDSPAAPHGGAGGLQVPAGGPAGSAGAGGQAGPSVPASPATPGTVAWRAAMSGPVTSLALTGGIVITGSTGATSARATQARRASSGAVLWSAAGTGPYGLAPGVIYIGDASSNLFATQTSALGTVIWGTPIGTGPIAGVTATARAAYVSAGDGSLNALGAAQGRLLWTEAVGPAKIVTDARAVYAVNSDGIVSAHRVSDGAALWQAGGEDDDDGGRGRGGPGPSRGGPGPSRGGDGDGDENENENEDADDGGAGAITVAGGVVYVSTGVRVLALRAGDGSLIWEYVPGSQVTSGIAVNGQAVYAGTGDGSVLALAAASGARIWSAAATGPVASGIVAAGGAVYYGTDAHTIEAVTAGAGTRRWSFTTDAPVRSQVTAGGGLVYAGSNGSTVYALHA